MAVPPGAGPGTPARSGCPIAPGSSSEKGNDADDTAKEPSEAPQQPFPNIEVAWNLLCLNLSYPALEALGWQFNHPESWADSY